MASIAVYTLWHVGRQEFMPCRMFRTSARGFSHWPDPDIKPHDPNPRIFYTLQAARNALAMWQMGKWERTEMPGEMFDPYEEGTPKPVPPGGLDRGFLIIKPMFLSE